MGENGTCLLPGAALAHTRRQHASVVRRTAHLLAQAGADAPPIRDKVAGGRRAVSHQPAPFARARHQPAGLPASHATNHPAWRSTTLP